MEPRQRLLKAFRREIPDHVPCVPDLFEMVPFRLSDRPSWEVLLYGDPPIWKVRADAAFHYGVDAFIIARPPMDEHMHWAILHREEDQVIARSYRETERGLVWAREAHILKRNDASSVVLAESIGLPAVPDRFEKVVPNDKRRGREWFEAAREYVGERGVVVAQVGLPCLSHYECDMLAYCEDPEGTIARNLARGEDVVKQTELFLSWKPDGLLIGNSGMMLFNPPDLWRRMSLPCLKKVTALARKAGVFTHVHCCGPERLLVEICANETDLDGIEPLEAAPQGDCDLRDLKQRFGKKLCLKGNLHTTDIMLRGTPEEVETACKRAIDDAAEGGGFILSTGDQTPRDVKDETIEIMRSVAENYGRY